MDKEKTIEYCSHNYQYSHNENKSIYMPSTSGNRTGSVDVVVCTKCGDVKRTEK